MAIQLYALDLNLQRYFWLSLIVLFTIMAFAVNGPIFLAYTTVALLFFFVLLVDYMFGDEKSFVYDPDYNNWCRRNE